MDWSWLLDLAKSWIPKGAGLLSTYLMRRGGAEGAVEQLPAYLARGGMYDPAIMNLLKKYLPSFEEPLPLNIEDIEYARGLARAPMMEGISELAQRSRTQADYEAAAPDILKAVQAHAATQVDPRLWGQSGLPGKFLDEALVKAQAQLEAQKLSEMGRIPETVRKLQLQEALQRTGRAELAGKLGTLPAVQEQARRASLSGFLKNMLESGRMQNIPMPMTPGYQMPENRLTSLLAGFAGKGKDWWGGLFDMFGGDDSGWSWDQPGYSYLPSYAEMESYGGMQE